MKSVRVFVFSFAASVVASFVVSVVSAEFSQAARSLQRIQASGSTYRYSCGYYSNTVGNYHFQLTDHTLPWGTEVVLHYGLTEFAVGEDTSHYVRKWERPAHFLAEATGPYTWTASPGEITLHVRSRSENYDSIDFVFEARLPDGTQRFIRGGKGILGFSRIVTNSEGSAPCVSDTSAKPVARPVRVVAVDEGT